MWNWSFNLFSSCFFYRITHTHTHALTRTISWLSCSNGLMNFAIKYTTSFEIANECQFVGMIHVLLYRRLLIKFRRTELIWNEQQTAQHIVNTCPTEYANINKKNYQFTHITHTHISLDQNLCLRERFVARCCYCCSSALCSAPVVIKI